MADHNVEPGMAGEAAVRASAGLSSSAGAPPTAPFTRLKGPALWLVVLLLAGAALFWRLDIRTVWEPPYLQLVLQIALVGVTSLIVAALAMRSFLRTGNWPVLWLGAGSLVYGLGTSLSNMLLQWVSINAAVTTHNLNALLASSLHVLGAFFVYNGIARRQGDAGRLRTVVQVYLGWLAIVVLITIGGLAGLLPPFFVQGQGGTPWRQMVVAADGLLFFLAGMAFLDQYRRTMADFLYWYALGLLLNALVMGGTLLTMAVGGPLSWLVRGAQLLGGAYLLLATLITLRQARAKNLPPGEVLASFFWADEANLKVLFESIMDAIIVTDRHDVITDWNQAAEAV